MLYLTKIFKLTKLTKLISSTSCVDITVPPYNQHVGMEKDAASGGI